MLAGLSPSPSWLPAMVGSWTKSWLMHFWTIWILTGKEGKVSDDRADVAGADEDGGGVNLKQAVQDNKEALLKLDEFKQIQDLL